MLRNQQRPKSALKAWGSRLVGETDREQILLTRHPLLRVDFLRSPIGSAVRSRSLCCNRGGWSGWYQSQNFLVAQPARCVQGETRQAKHTSVRLNFTGGREDRADWNNQPKNGDSDYDWSRLWVTWKHSAASVAWIVLVIAKSDRLP